MLSKPLAVLEQRYTKLDYLVDQHFMQLPRVGYSRMHRINALEGALSVAWQTWCGFCREVLHRSLCGTTTTEGSVVAPTLMAPSYGRIAYIAKQLVAGGNINPTKEAAPHNEPTWGDPRYGLELIDHFGPANAEALERGLNLNYQAPEHMRCVRNATAHLSSHGLEDVKAISVYYRGQGILHPLDLLAWRTKDEGALVFTIWLEDLKDMAREMCR